MPSKLPESCRVFGNNTCALSVNWTHTLCRCPSLYRLSLWLALVHSFIHLFAGEFVPALFGINGWPLFPYVLSPTGAHSYRPSGQPSGPKLAVALIQFCRIQVNSAVRVASYVMSHLGTFSLFLELKSDSGRINDIGRRWWDDITHLVDTCGSNLRSNIRVYVHKCETSADRGRSVCRRSSKSQP